MALRVTTRSVAASAATTLAFGALTVFGASVAGAAPATVTWDWGANHFTRTVTDATPAPGETITVTTKFERTNSDVEYIFNIKDRHAACLTYVPGSAMMNQSPITPTVVQDGSVP